jgi:lipopolysaccharide transport system permease protein
LLVKRDFSVRTSGTVLGGIWMLLQPALQVLAFWFLLDVIMRVRFPGHVTFVSYFLIGMLPWLMLNEALQRNMMVMSEFSALYRRSAFPLAILPLVPVFVSGITYGTVYVIVALLTEGLKAAILAAMIIPILLIWLVHFGYLLAVIGLFVPDTRRFVPFLLTITMYVTPILYAPTMIPEDFRWLLAFNPFADLLAMTHGLLQGLPFALGNVIRPAGLWLLLLGPAWLLFRRAEPHMREAL